MRYRLRELRIRRGYTQEKLAKKIGVGRSTYIDYEHGRTTPPVDKAVKLKKVLNYKKDDIFL